MKGKVALDDYVLFLAVADGGGLAAAVHNTGVSAPTLSRRMGQFEAQIGLRLFQRGTQGYSLTADGVALRDEARALQSVMARLAAFGSQQKKARVRITAGMWTSRHIARNIAQVWSTSAHWVPEFLPTGTDMDIARRVADIGVRNRRPTQSWLASLRTGVNQYAPFAASQTVRGWIALADPATTLPTQRWIYQHQEDEIVTTTSDPRLALDLAEAGVGQIILPLFAAEGSALVQCGDTIPELSSEEWLVAHQDARNDPPVRAALDALRDLLKSTSSRATHIQN